MNTIQKGKRPIQQKPQRSTTPLNMDDIFANPLGLDPLLVKAIEDKGYAYRFINYAQFAQMGGTHTAHWRPVSRKQLKEWGYDILSTHEFLGGSDADGYVRRGDLILAVRTKEINIKHKEYLKQEAKRGMNIQKQHAEALRQLVRTSGLDAQVHEGYEDEGDDVETE